jgi:hypothetical protein
MTLREGEDVALVGTRWVVDGRDQLTLKIE